MKESENLLTEIIETFKDLFEIIRMIFTGEALNMLFYSVKMPFKMVMYAGRMWSGYGKRLGIIMTIPFAILAIIGIASGATFYYVPGEETLFPQFFCDNMIIKAIFGAIAVYVINRLSLFNMIFNFFFSMYFLLGILPSISKLDENTASPVAGILALVVAAFTMLAKYYYYDTLDIQAEGRKAKKEEQRRKAELEKAKNDPNYVPQMKKKRFDIGDVAIDAIKNSINKRKNKNNSTDKNK